MLHDSSNALDTITAPTYQPGFHSAQSTFHMVWALDAPGSTDFSHHQLRPHQRHLGKLPSGLMDSRTRVLSNRRSPLPPTPGQRGFWVLPGAHRAWG